MTMQGQFPDNRLLEAAQTFLSRTRLPRAVRTRDQHVLLCQFDGGGGPIPPGQAMKAMPAWDCEIIGWNVHAYGPTGFMVDGYDATFDIQVYVASLIPPGWPHAGESGWMSVIPDLSTAPHFTGPSNYQSDPNAFQQYSGFQEADASWHRLDVAPDYLMPRVVINRYEWFQVVMPNPTAYTATLALLVAEV